MVRDGGRGTGGPDVGKMLHSESIGKSVDRDGAEIGDEVVSGMISTGGSSAGGSFHAEAKDDDSDDDDGDSSGMVVVGCSDTAMVVGASAPGLIKLSIEGANAGTS